MAFMALCVGQTYRPEEPWCRQGRSPTIPSSLSYGWTANSGSSSRLISLSPLHCQLSLQRASIEAANFVWKLHFMSIGLMALFDDVAAIAKAAAQSLDDIAGQTGKAGMKAAGVVIDDAAVTPRYVIGFAAKRELPIVGKIAAGSLRNKVLVLLPATLVLSYFVPWAITPLLMLGGSYLCYEGVEKL